MATRKIVFSGSDVLTKKTKSVVNFDDNLSILLDDMYETMLVNDGIGLAAPQVGILKSVVVIEVNGLKLDLVNPEIIEKVGSCEGIEGCLSVKNIQGYVTRPEKITFKAFDRYGTPYKMTVEGLLARCVCHELDHLNGVLFTDIMTELYMPGKKEKK